MNAQVVPAKFPFHKLQSKEKLRDFIERVVGQLDGKIVSQSKFDCFVHWHARASRQATWINKMSRILEHWATDFKKGLSLGEGRPCLRGCFVSANGKPFIPP